jgi:large subunit ribosomal protein L4
MVKEKEAKVTKTAKPAKKAVKKEVAKSTLSIPVYDLTGKETEKMSVSEHLFGQLENEALVAQYVRVYTQNQRQGNAAAKTRGEVIGSTRKIYKQKGTGRARHGSKKANLFKGGGVTFGPLPRDFSLTMSKKQKRLALSVSLSMKMQDKGIVGLTETAVSMKPKTKQIVDFISALKLTDKKILFVVSKVEKNGFIMSIRNIENVDVIQADTINPYTILVHNSVIFVGKSIESLETHFGETNESN